MKNLNLLAAFCFVIASCNHANNNNIAYRISEKDLIPEGIAYSSTTNSFYLSSISTTKIIGINAETCEFKDFIPSDKLNLCFLGLLVDDSRNHLWACGFRTENGKYRSFVTKFNLVSGEIVKSYSSKDTTGFAYNDLTEDTDGNIYFTDSEGQCVYKIDSQNDSLTIFYDGTEILRPNGITISPDNKYLYVASIDKGIRVLDIGNREIVGEPDTTINSKGIDGFKFYQNSLIGIQNDVKTRSEVKIVQYFLDSSGTKITGMKIIDQDNPLFDIPTTFTIVENNLYCLANSQLWNLNAENKIFDTGKLKDVVILKYKLN